MRVECTPDMTWKEAPDTITPKELSRILGIGIAGARKIFSKVKSAEKYFKRIKLNTIDFELDEPRSDDIQEIAKSKVCQAYEMVKKLVLH